MTRFATDEFAAFIGLDWAYPNMIFVCVSQAPTNEF
jgi:hypothetical protein